MNRRRIYINSKSIYFRFPCAYKNSQRNIVGGEQEIASCVGLASSNLKQIISISTCITCDS